LAYQWTLTRSSAGADVSNQIEELKASLIQAKQQQNQQFIEAFHRMTRSCVRKPSQENSRQSCNKLGRDSWKRLQPSGTGRGQNGEPETLAWIVDEFIQRRLRLALDENQEHLKLWERCEQLQQQQQQRRQAA